MPGPWIGSGENPGFAAKRDWESGEYFECQMYDSGRAAQGKALWRVIMVGERTHGLWLTATLIAVEDAHLKWWLDEGPGKTQRREFFIHICAADTKGCRGHEAKDPFAFHTDCIRMLEAADLVNRRAAWWITGVAKADFEAYRKDMVEVKKRGATAAGGHDDADVFSLDDEQGRQQGGDTSRAPGEAELAVGEDLRRLKGEVAKEKRKAKKPAREKSPRPRDRKDDDSPHRKEKKSRSRSKKVAKKDGPAGQKEQNWFGKKINPRCKSSSSSRGRSRGNKRKRSRSDSRDGGGRARRRKRSKECDRGPFGIGKLMEFDKEREDASESVSDDEGFHRGGSDRRSHQLRLVEYSQKRPGRLASRLLVKMRGLLARDAGSPFNIASNPDLTPATATSYLLTVMIPTYRDKMGIRLLREIRTVSAALDQIACGQGEIAADILGQRLKALELQMNDGGWQRAQFLELIAPEGAGLAEQEEQRMAAKEQAIEARMLQVVGRPKAAWTPSEGKGKGEGLIKGKGKKGGKRGKWQPADQTDNKAAAPIA